MNANGFIGRAEAYGGGGESRWVDCTLITCELLDPPDGRRCNVMCTCVQPKA